jgi:hypothetical protein
MFGTIRSNQDRSIPSALQQLLVLQINSTRVFRGIGLRNYVAKIIVRLAKDYLVTSSDAPASRITQLRCIHYPIVAAIKWSDSILKSRDVPKLAIVNGVKSQFEFSSSNRRQRRERNG